MNLAEQARKAVMEVDFNEFVENVLKKNELDYCIVGSMALKMLGMEIDAHDVDLEVICTPEQEEVFKVLADAYGNEFYKAVESGCKCVENYPENAEKRMPKITWTHKPYLFKWKNTMVNVWCVTEFSHPYVELRDGTKYATVMSVIRTKTAYRRRKDICFIMELMKKLMSFVD